MSENTTILSVLNITKQFGGLVAVKNLSFDVEYGESVGIMGPNGAGKTTLLNIIAGECKPDSGAVKFKGKDITSLSCHEICKLGIARTFQIPQPFTNMTVKQNLIVAARYGGGLREKDAEYQADQILDFLGLSGWKNTPIKNLQTITLKILELARALASKPVILLLDEVAGGLTDLEIPQLLNVLKQVRSSGITVLLIEHIMKFMLEAVDRIIVMSEGIKIAEGTPDEVINNDKVIDVYLG